MIPIGLFLLFLTGVGPLFAWRRSSVESLRRELPVAGDRRGSCWWRRCSRPGMRHVYALISFGLCLFVALTDRHGILQGRARHRGQERA